MLNFLFFLEKVGTIPPSPGRNGFLRTFLLDYTQNLAFLKDFCTFTVHNKNNKVFVYVTETATNATVR